ncbi:hypothetical protein LXA43DRAFT_1095043 [Ganoderma leucocontextum]|nr:hypothetical protein LXA43DRAFT_1099780 [Ganoderma leucocontextum]KAI1788285.1 hypothetical protein LXA43DRAFT_1063656 [Ganoderma leucocontextum]KAI1790816.1 hypothetical protein LXA43DRAFT_1095043 [Ganoderma leucocontextum]
MCVPLPLKIFDILAPAIKGHTGVAREINFRPFIKVFTAYFGCTVEKRKSNLVKVSPPPGEHGVWYWNRVPFFVHKPLNGTLGRADLFRLQKNFNDLYGWDRKTFVRGRD